MRKNTTVLNHSAMLFTTLRRYELLRSIGFRKWSVIKTIAPRKSLHPCGYVPREKSRKTWVLGLPRTPKTEVVGHSSLSERHGSTNGPGTAQERTRLHGGALSAIPPPLRGAPSRSHAPFLRVSRTEEWQKKPRDFSRGGVSQAPNRGTLLLLLLRSDTPRINPGACELGAC
jgi:hypothetical protein